MNFTLAREIYGNTVWMVDPISFSSLFGILNQLRGGVELDSDGEEKLNSLSALSIQSKTKLIFSEYQLTKLSGNEEVISVINLNGAITKNGGASSYGMRQLSTSMNVMSNDNRVKGHIIITDSGGGSSNAVVFMADAIKYSQSLGKPVVQFVEKGGLSASAAYYIGSYSNFIYSESEDNLIGSIGTMIEVVGYPKEHKRKSDGAVFIRAYATKSFNKNKEYEQAIKGNLEPITTNLLNPHNEKFLKDVLNNRPQVKKEQLDGSIFQAKDVIGSLIDGIGTMEDAINKVIELSSNEINTKKIKESNNGKININNKNKKMTTEELKSAHPEVYSEILAKGISQRSDQVGAWMAHVDTDPEAVRKGIESGKDISQSEREAFFVKQNSKSKTKKLIEGSAQDIVTKESKGGLETKEEEEDIELKEAFDFKLD